MQQREGSDSRDVNGPDAAGALTAALRANGIRLREYISLHMPGDLREWLEPQDVVQDVFLDAFRRCNDYPAHDAEEGVRWLLTVARHRLIDLVRRRRAMKRGGTDREHMGFDDSIVAMLGELAQYTRTPSRSAAAREFFAALGDALDRLPAHYAQVIRLRHLEGLSQKDAAMKMGKSEKAVEVMCRRGIAALRVEMRSASLFV
jgi:RNA polymerase sigma factor (sigma-70 family)